MFFHTVILHETILQDGNEWALGKGGAGCRWLESLHPRDSIFLARREDLWPERHETWLNQRLIPPNLGIYKGISFQNCRWPNSFASSGPCDHGLLGVPWLRDGMGNECRRLPQCNPWRRGNVLDCQWYTKRWGHPFLVNRRGRYRMEVMKKIWASLENSYYIFSK